MYFRQFLSYDSHRHAVDIAIAGMKGLMGRERGAQRCINGLAWRALNVKKQMDIILRRVRIVHLLQIHSAFSLRQWTARNHVTLKRFLRTLQDLLPLLQGKSFAVFHIMTIPFRHQRGMKPSAVPTK